MLYPYQTASAPVDEEDETAEWQAPEIPVDPIRFAADGGRMGYAGGGIAGLRQGYFLGKLVKKIGRGVKKVLKSPIGKAALIGLGGYYLGGGQLLGGSRMFGDKFGTKFALDNLMKRKGIFFLTSFNIFLSTSRPSFSKKLKSNLKLYPSNSSLQLIEVNKSSSKCMGKFSPC